MNFTRFVSCTCYCTCCCCSCSPINITIPSLFCDTLLHSPTLHSPALPPTVTYVPYSLPPPPLLPLLHFRNPPSPQGKNSPFLTTCSAPNKPPHTPYVSSPSHFCSCYTRPHTPYVSSPSHFCSCYTRPHTPYVSSPSHFCSCYTRPHTP